MTQTMNPAPPRSLPELAAVALKARQDAEAAQEAADARNRQRWQIEACTRLAAAAHEMILDTLGEVADRVTWKPLGVEVVETTLDGYRVQVRADDNIDRVRYPSLWLRLPCEAGCTDADFAGTGGTLWHRIDPPGLPLGEKHRKRAETLADIGTLLAEHAAGRWPCPACEWSVMCQSCYDREHVDGKRCQQCIDRIADEAAIEAAALAAETLPSLSKRLTVARPGDPATLAALALEHAREAAVSAETPDTGAIVTALNGVALALVAATAPRPRRRLFARSGGGR